MMVFVDCKLVFERQIPDLKLDIAAHWDRMHLWIGQRNTRHVYFKGAMEYLKLVFSGEGYLEQCPLANVACPTCSQFQQLQLSVQQLQSVVTELTKQVVNANQRILELEECECRKQCKVDGQVYRDGEVVQPKEQCSSCKCKGGVIVCEKQICPVVRCENPEVPEGDCCPVCLKRCFFNNLRHEHGEEFSPKPCHKCVCKNGRIDCQRTPRKSCPRLQCPKEKQITLPDECCKVCNGSDFCSLNRHQCAANSTCINLETKFTCQCDRGFKTVGKTCQDVDECKTYGGPHGHHCNSNSQCVNTLGSYYCECLPGYEKIDQYTCREMDMCERVGRSVCHARAQCLNTPGSYVCQCAVGYEGDGIQCNPICSEPCRNGGHCVDVGICRCHKGYRGKNCDTDIDECSEGIAACHPNSICINVPGSYYCQCKDGYHSSQLDNNDGALCQDLNECQGWGGGQHCPALTVCHNMDGGYECQCIGNSSCRPGCIVDGKLYQSGSSWQLEDEPCSTCRCENGKVTCESRFVTCQQSESLAAGSQQQCCIDSHTCPHQVLPLVYTTGQKWHYQCSICQCHDGETDCWPMDCPKLNCFPVVHDAGACCPRCARPDPCATVPQQKSSSEASSCTFKGQVMPNKHTWTSDSDRCSSCQCQDGNICCSYDHVCSDGIPTPKLPSHQQNQNGRTFLPQLQSTEADRPHTSSRMMRPRARTRHEERQTEDNG